MKDTCTIKLNREFQRVYKRGQHKGGKYISVYVFKNRLGSNRLGITVGKKFGNSVQRNRMKRLIRECYRLIGNNLCGGYDFVVVARASERTAASPDNKLKALYVPGYKEVWRDMEKCMTGLGLVKVPKREETE